METRANYVIVGIFTLAAILAAFAFVYWTAAIGDRGETTMLRVRIPGSASGLGRGSFVLFNGVKVGDVRRVYIDVDNPTVAIADTEVDRMTPITKSTQADIGLAGLTGQANIELKGADPKEPKLLDQAEAEGKVAEIVANPSAVTNLLQTAQDIFTRADKVLSDLEGFTRDVRGPLTQTVQNAQKFSDALARNSDGVDKFLASVSSLSQTLQGVSGKLDGTLTAAQDLLNSVDRDKVREIVANIDGTTKNLKATSDRFDEVIGNVNTAVGSINTFAGKTQDTLAKVDKVLDGIDPNDVRQALANIAKTEAIISQKLVRAPFDGELGVRHVNVGQYLTAGTPIVSLTDLSQLYANFTVPENDSGKLKVGQVVKVAVDAYPGRTFDGKITTIEPQIATDTRNIQIQATIANPDHILKPGMFVTTTVVLPNKPPVVTVPETAVDYTLYGDSVYLITAKKEANGKTGLTAVQTYVKAGDRVDGRAEIIKGLKAGDRVVAVGQLRLQSGAAVSISPNPPPPIPAQPPRY